MSMGWCLGKFLAQKVSFELDSESCERLIKSINNDRAWSRKQPEAVNSRNGGLSKIASEKQSRMQLESYPKSSKKGNSFPFGAKVVRVLHA